MPCTAVHPPRSVPCPINSVSHPFAFFAKGWETSKQNWSRSTQFRHPFPKLRRRVRLAKECSGDSNHRGSSRERLCCRGQRYAADSDQNRTSAGLCAQPAYSLHADGRNRGLLCPCGKNRADGKIIYWLSQNSRQQRRAAAEGADDAAWPKQLASLSGCQITRIYMNAIKANLFNQIRAVI